MRQKIKIKKNKNKNKGLRFRLSRLICLGYHLYQGTSCVCLWVILESPLFYLALYYVQAKLNDWWFKLID